MMKCKAVIFDLFGTLVDSVSNADNERVLAQMAAVLGVAREEFLAGWSEPGLRELRWTGAFLTLEDNLEHLLQARGLPVPREQVEEAVRLRVEASRRWLRPRGDAVEVLEQLRAGGRRIGLISDCSPEVPGLWRETALAPLVEAPVFSSEVGMRKPAQRIYHLACEALGVGPEDCVYVGDGGSHELSGAARVGMRPIRIRSPHEQTYDAYRVDEDAWEGPTVESLSEILGLAAP